LTGVLQYHKLNAEPAVKAHAKDPIAEKVVVDNIVVTAVAMKSVAQ
jgi:EKC/KEOPS complex subunit CGI121/TPRKB